jgi:hypothetical protein
MNRTDIKTVVRALIANHGPYQVDEFLGELWDNRANQGHGSRQLPADVWASVVEIAEREVDRTLRFLGQD